MADTDVERRSRQLALSLIQLGETEGDAVAQLIRWRYSTAIANDAVAWAVANEGKAVFTFVVTVTTDSKAHAEQVMAERLDYDEEYGFPYSLQWSLPRVESWMGESPRFEKE